MQRLYFFPLFCFCRRHWLLFGALSFFGIGVDSGHACEKILVQAAERIARSDEHILIENYDEGEQISFEASYQYKKEQHHKKIEAHLTDCVAAVTLMQHWVIRTRDALHSTTELKVKEKRMIDMEVQQSNDSTAEGFCPNGMQQQLCTNTSRRIGRTSLGVGQTLGLPSLSGIFSVDMLFFAGGHRRTYLGIGPSLQFKWSPRIRLDEADVQRMSLTTGFTIGLNRIINENIQLIGDMAHRIGWGRTAGLNLDESLQTDFVLLESELALSGILTQRWLCSIAWVVPWLRERIVVNEQSYGPISGMIMLRGGMTF